MSDKKFININIIGYELKVACPIGEIDSLKKATQALKQRLMDLNIKQTTLNTEHIIMAALNISHDYIKITEAFDFNSYQRRIEEMNNLIDTTLNTALETS